MQHKCTEEKNKKWKEKPKGHKKTRTILDNFKHFKTLFFIKHKISSNMLLTGSPYDRSFYFITILEYGPSVTKSELYLTIFLFQVSLN